MKNRQQEPEELNKWRRVRKQGEGGKRGGAGLTQSEHRIGASLRLWRSGTQYAPCTELRVPARALLVKQRAAQLWGLPRIMGRKQNKVGKQDGGRQSEPHWGSSVQRRINALLIKPKTSLWWLHEKEIRPNSNRKTWLLRHFIEKC